MITTELYLKKIKVQKRSSASKIESPKISRSLGFNKKDFTKLIKDLDPVPADSTYDQAETLLRSNDLLYHWVKKTMLKKSSNKVSFASMIEFMEVHISVEK